MANRNDRNDREAYLVEQLERDDLPEDTIRQEQRSNRAAERLVMAAHIAPIGDPSLYLLARIADALERIAFLAEEEA